jgi:radical SAM/Cys-rich protein
MRDTASLLKVTDFPEISRNSVSTLQVNLGYLCNLSCTHCHVNAGPTRTELMDADTVELVLQVLEKLSVETLDLTGGSPEMNIHFRYLVESARALGVRVMDRCNPTILVEPGYEYLPEFLASNKVSIVASLPCHSEQNVDRQRGAGVFTDSINGLKLLNDLGYGQPETSLMLDLVYNPDDPVLPPSQAELEQDYRRELRANHGIEFNSLFVLANMPISRFGARLLAKDQYHDYMTLLRDAYQATNLDNLMCRDMVSVDYKGYIYDCDFNQMLNLNLTIDERSLHLKDMLVSTSTDNQIIVGEHCYGCTAGQGSSCGGALDQAEL